MLLDGRVLDMRLRVDTLGRTKYIRNAVAAFASRTHVCLSLTAPSERPQSPNFRSVTVSREIFHGARQLERNWSNVRLIDRDCGI